MYKGSYFTKFGFTLSEVLITLGIIGVVAALTLPVLMSNARNKQFESALKKEYSVLLQALEMYKQENGAPLLKSDCTYKQQCFKNNIKPYLKILSDCGPDLCYKNYSFKYETYSGRNAGIDFFDDGQLVLSDGSALFFENPGRTDLAVLLYVTVDVNGFKRLPNKWGVDTFTFQLMDDGRLLPMGADGTDYGEDAYCSKTSTNNKNGIACTNKALKDPNYFKSF